MYGSAQTRGMRGLPDESKGFSHDRKHLPASKNQQQNPAETSCIRTRVTALHTMWLGDFRAFSAAGKETGSEHVEKINVRRCTSFLPGCVAHDDGPELRVHQ